MLCRAVDDFRFPLMRHWSVYDSIIHSRYVAVRLHTWQEKGKDKVRELLVRMGLSQRDCQADYCERSAASCLHFTPLHAVLVKFTFSWVCASATAGQLSDYSPHINLDFQACLYQTCKRSAQTFHAALCWSKLRSLV